MASLEWISMVLLGLKTFQAVLEMCSTCAEDTAFAVRATCAKWEPRDFHLHHIPVVQLCGGPEVPDACLEQDKLELAGCFEDCP